MYSRFSLFLVFLANNEPLLPGNHRVRVLQASNHDIFVSQSEHNLVLFFFISLFFFIFIYLFIYLFILKIYIYLFLAALGLCCCVWAFSGCGERALLFVAVRGLLIAVASLVAEHGL